MKMGMFFKNIKNQKGVTGADIVIAVTIIVITIAVVSMIYVNTTLESRNVTRTAGATRIATNILENIDKLSYEVFIKTFDDEMQKAIKQSSSESEYLNYYLIDGGDDETLFSTKIPKGYDVYIKAEPNYGSHTDAKEQFDLVRDINIIVAFNVGDRTEKIDFQTVKSREIIQEVNHPSTEYLTSSGILKSGMNYYPVKYLASSNAYIKVNENDELWYNYSNREWATVIVSKKDENEIFDINGKFIGTINTSESSEDYTVRFVWIPRFFTKTSATGKTEFYAFAYLGTGNNKIISSTLNSKLGDSNSTLTYNTFKEIETSEGANTDTFDYFDDKTGKWVSAENGIDAENGDVAAIVLNASKYGPYVSH